MKNKVLIRNVNLYPLILRETYFIDKIWEDKSKNFPKNNCKIIQSEDYKNINPLSKKISLIYE